MSAMSTAWMATTVTMSANPGGEWWLTPCCPGRDRLMGRGTGHRQCGGGSGSRRGEPGDPRLDMVIIISSWLASWEASSAMR